MRVLIAEDSPAFLDRISRHLNQAPNIDIVGSARDGAEALAALAAEPYDLVLMDCRMPVMDGYETTRRIRAGDAGVLDPHIPIVAMTANAMAGDRELVLEAGMNDYLSKPINPKTLGETLQRWLEKNAENAEQRGIA
ncbi:MAG TPA: response regulator [Rhodocyclaceae bacterium]|nr:response regulator [Rhodocyclaceae bacterium]